MRQYFTGDFLKGAVSPVAVQAIGAEEIVGHVEVGITILVIIEPRGREALVGSSQADCIADVDVLGSIVPEEVVVLACLHYPHSLRRVEHDVVLLTILFLDQKFSIDHLGIDFDVDQGRRSTGHAVGQQITVEISVQVVVSESHVHVGSLASQAESEGAIAEGAVALIVEEQVEVAHSCNE